MTDQQTAAILAFLQRMKIFQSLSPLKVEELAQQFQPWYFRSGQAILIKEQLPEHWLLIYQGKAQLMGYDAASKSALTLKILQVGDHLGGISLVRQVPTEVAIATSDTTCLALSADVFLRLLEQEPAFASIWQQHCDLSEAFDVLSLHASPQQLPELAAQASHQGVVRHLKPGENDLTQLERDRHWFISGGARLPQFPIGMQLSKQHKQLVNPSDRPLRLIGLPSQMGIVTQSPSPVLPTAAIVPPPTDYPFVFGRGQVGEAMACFQMVCQHLNIPFRREVIRRVLENQKNRTGDLSLQACGAVAELLGLNPSLLTLPTSTINRLQPPALIIWRGHLALIYAVTAQGLVLAVPENGIREYRFGDFAQEWGLNGQFLTLQPTAETPQQRFSLAWFLPSLVKYRRILVEVLVASFFVQLFGLANPLIVQLIIDKVLVQNSIETLNILGIFLLIVALFEALLSSVRTYLFVDTTNRIDVSLGTTIIDHLLRLPLRYFERRPVGELATRINELENIRTFLTSTALTVVLDAVFSVIYIAVMAFYSWQLTLIALVTIPFFVAVTWVSSPIVRQQLRRKAEDNAVTQSHLVEVLSGIQTVKAQNIELRSRWQWQQDYNRYIASGFKTVQTYTAATATSNFLNQVSGLLVLWAGAYMVLQGSLTLGQLIAFRIIAGYVTSPLLRLTQIWQNFQETALSLERLADILDTPQEAEDRTQIPMPIIKGEVRFVNVSFGYRQAIASALQLDGVNLTVNAGAFVGIVGASGSGKSTLMKLIPRLYEVQAGQIFIDNYDISKVELYSLRQQIGIVPQEPLLFDGTVQENIALTNPEASVDEIIFAARVAVAHEFIMGLPNGYNTRVGERGAALSGGQRQRIAIARTILQNPRMLILDEATSALDYDTERQLCQNIALSFQGRTVFFITHRLNTIQSADLIVVMDQGRVAEQGKHAALLAQQGIYYHLYNQQEAMHGGLL